MKIALTYPGSDNVHQQYQEWLQGKEEDIHILKLLETAGNKKELPECDALVLSGGVDIHPKLYGGGPDYPNRPEEGWNDLRDSFESALFKAALDRQLPVLGICRGLQLINVLLNGTLIQDIGNKAGNPVHEGSPDKQHPVEIEKNSLLYRITGQLSGTINSSHHQAIDKLGEGLMINSKSPDGIPEGIEWIDSKNKPFLLGIQWHAERMFKFDLQNTPLSANIRGQFINEIRKSRTVS